LGDALRTLLLGQSQEELDEVLPQIMQAYRNTLHYSTQEILNFLMLGHETQVLDHLTYHVPAPESPLHEYVWKLIKIMDEAYDALREKQWNVQTEDLEEPPLY